MLVASLLLFVLAFLIPNTLVLAAPTDVLLRRRLAYMPNVVFALVLGSFVAGVAHSLMPGAGWSAGLVVYLALELLYLASVLILLWRKERHKKELLRAAQADAPSGGDGEDAPRDIEITDEGEITCVPTIKADTGTPDAEYGWEVSSLLSWHVYLYRLSVRFKVSATDLEVTARAETYDANWYELAVGAGGTITWWTGVGALVALVAGGSVASSHYVAERTAKANILCWPAEGKCALWPNVDPAGSPAKDKEVEAMAMIAANRLTPDVVQFHMQGVATMSGHLTVQSVTAGGTAGGSTVLPGVGHGTPTPSTGPIQVQGSINVGVQLVPSANAEKHLPAGRSVLIKCEEQEQPAADSAL